MINTRVMKASPEGMHYVWANTVAMWMGLVCNILAICTLVLLVQRLYQKTLTGLLIFQAGSICVLAILGRHWCNILAARYSGLASNFIKITLRQRIYRKILDFGLGYTQRVSTARITQIAGEGIEQIEVYFGQYLPQFFYSMLAPLTLFAILSFFSLPVSLVLLFCVPLIPISIILINKIAKKILHKYWGAYTGLGDGFLDNLQGLTTLKIYQDDGYKNVEMNKEAQTFRRITMKMLTMQLNSVSLMDLIAYGGTALGIILALAQFSSGRINLSQVLIFILLSSEFFIPLRLLGSYFHIAMNGSSVADQIFKILDEPVARTGSLPCDFSRGDIQFKNINFSYDADRTILHDINIDIPKNSFVSLVGASGCGKSTLAALLMGFVPYQQGSISCSNVELSSIDPRQWVEHVCIVKHKNYIFKGTVYENLQMGDPQACVADMDKALKAVDLYKFVYDAGGLDFPLSEGGKNLSGGQAQRLALARALLHHAGTYIFDEASSNIDRESEAIILQAIQHLRKTKTVIMISHRLANVVDSDKIYVLDKGHIVAQGNHTQLMEEQGLYYTMYTQQRDLETQFTTQEAPTNVI